MCGSFVTGVGGPMACLASDVAPIMVGSAARTGTSQRWPVITVTVDRETEHSMASDRMTEMTLRECMQLLAANHFGRVAVNDDDGPVILPVNYILDGDSVLFRSGSGTKLRAGLRGSPASFEIDAVRERTRTGWSVVARGTLTDVYDPDEIARARRFPLEPFAGGDRPYYLRLLVYEVSGRSIALPEGAPDGWFRPTGLGYVWLNRDAADLGL